MRDEVRLSWTQKTVVEGILVDGEVEIVPFSGQATGRGGARGNSPDGLVPRLFQASETCFVDFDDSYPWGLTGIRGGREWVIVETEEGSRVSSGQRLEEVLGLWGHVEGYYPV